MKQTGIVIFSLLLIFTEALSQELHFRQYELPGEFRDESINVILQTSDNFIWLGTSNGLFRFDGSAYRHFLQDSSDSNNISALYEDDNGVVWIGYNSGKIGKFKGKGFVPFLPEEGFPRVPVTGFAQDSNNDIWFSTYGEGAYCFKNSRLYNFNTDDGMPDNYIYSITADHEGEVWLGTDRGIAICNYRNAQKNINILDASGMLPDNIVTALALDSSGIWIGMESKGISRYSFKSDTIEVISDEWTYGRVTSFKPMKDQIFVGTLKNGIVKVNKNSGNKILAGTPEKSMSKITQLAGDNEGNIWVATGSSSFYITSSVFTFIRHADGKPIKNIQAILRTRENNLFYSTDEGLFLLEYNTKNVFTRQEVKLSNKNLYVISMYEDQDGFIWFGTFDEGVYRYNQQDQTVRQLTEADGLINNNVLSITGRDNELWFATLGGVSRCELKGQDFELTNYDLQSGLSSNYIYQVYSDSKGRLWFATDGKGITMLADNKFTNFSSSEGLKSNIIYSITEDASGDIWASTSNAGLYRYDGKGFKAFIPSNDIRDLSITSIIGDPKDNILIVSRSGIDILNPSSGSIFYNSEEVGIYDIDPNLNAYSIDLEGNVWLGTQSGIIKYHPSKNIKLAETKINEMQVFLKPVNEERKELSYDKNHISFDYTGFWYLDPNKVTYLIKLEGYDREWMHSRNNFITYPNLPPGDYSFKVKSSTTGYFDDATPQIYSFTISPPFYSSIWFYLLMLTIAGGFMFLFVKTREKKLKAAERQKKEQVEFKFETLKSQVNPHFLFNSFNTLIAVIEEDQETAVEYVEKLSDFYRKILEYREQNVIPLKEELEMISNYYFLQMKRYKQNFKININVPEDQQQNFIPPMTLQLLVENAVKHNIISRDKPLSIYIDFENDYLLVKNNFQPRNYQEPSTGMGLNNIIHRFGLLTTREVLIEQTEKQFIVKIPLLREKK
ncbi:MAG: two-component regulator propeller domain-containing protein [Candidatus Cyclobacteriaceae bacterium M2_1C_046]